MLKVLWERGEAGFKQIKSYVHGQGIEMLRYLSDNENLGYFRSLNYCTEEGWPAKLVTNVEQHSTDTTREEREWIDNLKDLRDSLLEFDFEAYDSLQSERERKEHIKISIGQYGQKLRRLVPERSFQVKGLMMMVDIGKTTMYTDGNPIGIPKGFVEED